MGFKFTGFDGCMYRITSQKGRPFEMPIRKPWRIAFISSNIDNYLNIECEGSHGHEPCSGPNAFYAQCYTPSMCKAIMKSAEDGRRQDEGPGLA